ncbi:hypothetical protein NM208_g14703 [Fusarium decemcellulare]|uniref:Uncharacterized protein n=1 Tax=Fusarium decemcellulare TaxID=57161 RepID=A0ACC1RF65_9HYPO|nr:hypothetical protein NM208_g14703 [Fusarium decemcellulare]
MDCSDTQTQHGLLGMATSAFLFVACCSWAEKDASQCKRSTYKYSVAHDRYPNSLFELDSRQAWRTFCLWQHVQGIIISIMAIAYIWLLAQTSAACSREACTHGFNFALGLAILLQRDPPPPYEP